MLHKGTQPVEHCEWMRSMQSATDVGFAWEQLGAAEQGAAVNDATAGAAAKGAATSATGEERWRHQQEVQRQWRRQGHQQ